MARGALCVRPIYSRSRYHPQLHPRLPCAQAFTPDKRQCFSSNAEHKLRASQGALQPEPEEHLIRTPLGGTTVPSLRHATSNSTCGHLPLGGESFLTVAQTPRRKLFGSRRIPARSEYNVSTVIHGDSPLIKMRAYNITVVFS